MKKEGIAVVPGSFDPITNGHIDIIKKAAKLYEKVYVAVMINSQKKYMFSLEQRKTIAERAMEEIALDNVTVISSSGWLWELAKELGACAIVKGYRNDKDLAYEREMAEFNEKHNPDAKTVLIKADEKMTELSSTVIRQKIIDGESLEEFLPTKAIEEIKRILT